MYTYSGISASGRRSCRFLAAARRLRKHIHSSMAPHSLLLLSNHPSEEFLNERLFADLSQTKKKSPAWRRIVHAYGALTNDSLLPRTRSRLHCCLLPCICQRDSICLFFNRRVPPHPPGSSLSLGAPAPPVCLPEQLQWRASFSFICVLCPASRRRRRAKWKRVR